MLMTCPLCSIAGQTKAVTGADSRQYHLCCSCSLIFVDPCHHLSLAEEKAHYTTHENSIENDGYVNFLNLVLQPMRPYLDDTMRGLDYGCGPGPTLSQLLKRQGIACDDYDPLFASRPLQPPYDFIFATECFEHFYKPNKEIQQVCRLLKPGGLLGIMTECWTTLDQFAKWYYTKDPTHTAFFHEDTFSFLCRQFGLEVLWKDEKRVVIFRDGRNPGAGEGT
jgi:SAM-dependent methyltransferase